MDQKEIDALLNVGKSDLSDISKKQEGLAQKLKVDPPPTPEGKVIGQISRVTEEAEQGTNMVMNYLENVLSIITKQKEFLQKRKSAADDSPEMMEIINFFSDTTFICEDLIFNAMDAFQFQDINRQKLIKVMHTLSQLNDYLNDLLGTSQKRTNFGKEIEQKSLLKDEKKTEVDQLIEGFQKKNHP
jgi:hypothetical protein